MNLFTRIIITSLALTALTVKYHTPRASAIILSNVEETLQDTAVRILDLDSEAIERECRIISQEHENGNYLPIPAFCIDAH